MAAKKVSDKKPAKSETSSEGNLAVGKRAPAFELEDQTGAVVSSASLKGNRYVLYFYPKDSTPGCTTESCEFRDAQALFEGLKTRVLGVSPDSVASHARFATKFELPFTLLADTEKQLAENYKTWVLKKNYGREYMGIERSTFVVGPTGKLEHIWRKVRVKGHVEAVRQAIAGE